MTQTTRRLFYFFLVTLLCLANASRAIAADALSDKIDQDLFLEDEGSGRGPPEGVDVEQPGSGKGPIDGDDEDSAPISPDHPDRGSIATGAKKPVDFDNGRSNNKEHESNNPSLDNDPNKSHDDVFDKKETPDSFFSQPGILAAIICGAIVGLLCAILLVMFIVYRMRKKDEGSYVLDDSKRTTSSYGKSKEFYA